MVRLQSNIEKLNLEGGDENTEDQVRFTLWGVLCGH